MTNTLYNINSNKYDFSPILGGFHMVRKLRINEKEPNNYKESTLIPEKSKIDLTNPITIAALEEARLLANSPEKGFTNLEDFWKDVFDDES